MPRNLLLDLLHPSVENDELLIIIEQLYGSAGQLKEYEYVYPSSHSFALKLLYSKEGVLEAIEPGRAFSQQKFDELKEKVRKELVEYSEAKIGREILFSSTPVKGSFRATSKTIQILPAPSDAPKPDILIADHPFILELPLKTSTNGFVTNSRRIRKLKEWAWILNALLRTNIKILGPRYQHFWALYHENDQKPITSSQIKYVQEFYFLDGFNYYEAALTEQLLPELTSIPFKDYYSAKYTNTHDELKIPDNLSETIQRISNLSGDNRKRFLRAVQWMSVSNDIWTHHISSAFIAQVIAIESLIDRSQYPKMKSTARFKTFVQQYSSASDSEASILYEVRSSLAHGWDLFHFDSPQIGVIHHPQFLRDQGAIDQINDIRRPILLNWLWQTKIV